MIFYNNVQRDGNTVRVNMNETMPTIVRQLKLLLGFKEVHYMKEGFIFLFFSFYSLKTANLQAIASINGYSYTYFALVFTLSSFLKDFDHLLMVQTIERLLLAKQSLISLIELLDDVKNMVINDHIQHEVCVLLLLLNPLSQVMESLSQLNKVQ